ncbi:hypothetical protein ACFGVR_07965 [Mucilaginibacter sp. AW1-3]
MTGSLAQVIALVSFGNEFLTTGSLPDNFYPDNSVFQYCKSINFFDFKKGFLRTKQIMVAEDPTKWLDFLKSDGCKKLRLSFQEDGTLEQDHKLAAFVGGGGLWLIEAINSDGYSTLWANKWEVIDPDAADRKIWGISYIAIQKNQAGSTTQTDLSIVKGEFSDCLHTIADFAYKNNLLSWGAIFDKANDTLSNNNPISEDYYKDFIIDKNYSLLARQLLISAKKAWVFGGMGSWNDMWFESDEENKVYSELSANLYENVNNAIIAAINNNTLTK